VIFFLQTGLAALTGILCNVLSFLFLPAAYLYACITSAWRTAVIVCMVAVVESFQEIHKETNKQEEEQPDVK